jgi:hypothetical protein
MAAAYCQRGLKYLQRHVLDGKARPGVDQCDSLIMFQRLDAARTGGLDIELSQNLRRNSVVVACQEFTGTLPFGDLCWRARDRIEQDIGIQEIQDTGPWRSWMASRERRSPALGPLIR